MGGRGSRHTVGGSTPALAPFGGSDKEKPASRIEIRGKNRGEILRSKAGLDGFFQETENTRMYQNIPEEIA